MWRHLPKFLFFSLIVRPLVFFILGLVVYHRERLPQCGPCIIVANHNSHLDTMVLMSLFPLRDLPRVRPVAAADYFLSNRLLAWFALNVIGVIPIPRKAVAGTDSLFADCRDALAQGNILILYPEGTRGEPEKMGSFKRGIHYLAYGNPNYPITPIYLCGLGKALPKGEALLVPFNVHVAVGMATEMAGDAKQSTAHLESCLRELADQVRVCVDDD